MKQPTTLAFAVAALWTFGADAARAELRNDLSYVDKDSPAYSRYKEWVDTAVSGNPGYAFSAVDAVLMHQLTGNGRYCDIAVRMVQQQVDEANAKIAQGARPAVAGDSYLEAGPMISELARTWQWCGERIPDEQRPKWSAYADQAIRNIWSPKSASWGGTPATWTGWSIDNPGNNYYYSFVEATMDWALASNDEALLKLLREDKLPALKGYFAKLPGGGSLEGTGYGAAHMRLFTLYRTWKDSTGEDLANANPHLSDSIRFWIHATVPTLDRFAPFGDQSRVSVPEIFDYHRRLVLEARMASKDEEARALASWWLGSISLQRMSQGFNFRYDLLPAGDAKEPPRELVYHATGTGRLFARTGWDRDAMWMTFTAGPYVESHAHQDQGSFTLFARDWLAVTENVWTHSGIQQGTDVHNLVRFVRNGATIRQREPSTSTMTLTRGATPGEVHASADLGGAYAPGAGVESWKREIDFAARKLTVRDRYATSADTRAIFQVNVPSKPQINGREAIAGRLRIRVVSPEDATLSVLEWSTLDAAEFRSGWRVDVEGGGDGFVVELTDDAG